MPQSLMVWDDICSKGKKGLALKDEVVKIDLKRTVKIACRVLSFPCLKSTLEMKNGLCSKILLPHTVQDNYMNDVSHLLDFCRDKLRPLYSLDLN